MFKQQSVRTLCQLILFSVVVVGCIAGMNDSYFRVKGNLADHPSSNAPCVIRLHAEETGRVVDYRDVIGPFETSFVISAGSASYYFTVECPGGATFRSINYELGRSEDFDSTIDLGDVTFGRSELPQ